MEKQVNTLLLTSKMFVNIMAYTGLLFGIDQELLNSKLIDALHISPILSNAIVFVGLVFWIIKAVWYIYEKFYLERTERLHEINRKKKLTIK